MARRRVLRLGLAVPLALAPVAALARIIGGPPRRLAFDNLHTGERQDLTYWADGAYIADSVARMNILLRDFRTGETKAIDLRLFDLLHALRQMMGSAAPFGVVSGYRSPQTNAALRRKSRGVAKHSLHMRGMAIDIRLPGRAPPDLRAAAIGLAQGGVGYYPQSGFVHVDVGRVRSWTG